MEETYQNNSPWGTAIKWGLIGGIIYLALQYLQFLQMGDDFMVKAANKTQQMLGMLTLIPLLGVLIFAQIQHKQKDLGGYMSYARGIGVAAIMGLTVGILSAIYNYVLFTFIAPDLLEQIMEKTMEAAENQTEEQLEQTVKMMRMFMNPVVMSVTELLGKEFALVVLGLITSIFTRKERPE
jgi:hypothetical protein